MHLRSGSEREWRSFPAVAQGSYVSLSFNANRNQREYSLIVRQRDVKAPWTVSLNNVPLGVLVQDERAMLRIMAVPAGVLRAGVNNLQVAGKPGRFSDDIYVEDLRIEDMPVSELQAQATINVAVAGESGPLPVRITIVDSKGSLTPVNSARTGVFEAIRTGVVYTADGQASIKVPAGEYQVYASRGFEYSAPSGRVRVEPGKRASVPLKIRREVDMTGYASCDTHVHTFELSGHGDASVDERVLTAAGESLDVIVATEHNKFSDYSAALRKRSLGALLTTIPGNEVTTATGHFNIFPVRQGAPQPSPSERDWPKLMDTLKKAEGVAVVVQNHPRDLHSDYRPFDSRRHLSLVGENLEGRPFLANAMEVVNSGAMASDPLQLVLDWMGLLTRGLPVAAIGASDTHTVDFVPIGQARTYIDVTAIPNWRKDPAAIAKQLSAGQNLVSYGLAVDIRQNGPVRSASVPIEVSVWGPSWAAADRVTIYSNGMPVWSQNLDANRKAGRKFSATIPVPIPMHDTALVALATGPNVSEPFWEVRKPYQPTSDEWNPIVLGVSRAVWVDSDKSGNRNSPADYARGLIDKHGTNIPALLQALAEYDGSVTIHVLNLMRVGGQNVDDAAVRSQFLNAPSTIRDGYKRYTEALRASKQ